MSDFLAYERIKELHELYEGAKDLCVSIGTPLENFADADAKWKDVIDEMYKKVQGGIVSEGSENDVFVYPNEVIIPARYLDGTKHKELRKKYLNKMSEFSKE
jgi:hypothetical protein